MLHRDKIGETMVIKGYISSSDLENALVLQKLSNRPLGELLVQDNKISQSQLFWLLCRQKTIRCLAAGLLFGGLMSGTVKRSHASSIKDVPAKISLAFAESAGIKDIKSYPALMGSSEKKSDNLKAFTKWTGMFERFEKSLKKQSSKKIIAKLQYELSNFKSLSVHAMAKNVNKLMNEKKYIVDDKNWGKSDYWATPIEFLKYGGDCEDFAIAKYTALRALGVPENRMRLLILQDLKKNMPHAVLVVYSEKGPMILDNQIKEMRQADTIAHYKPIFSINRDAWWLHTTEDKPTTIVASAE